jgi:hypothetical protein
VPLQNAFNPFTVADATLPDGTPVTTGVRFRGLQAGNRDAPTTFNDILFDVGLRGEMSEFGDYFKTWNWEAGFRYSRNEEEVQSRNIVSQPGLHAALLDTDPATAFNPFTTGSNTPIAQSRVYVTLHNSGQFELPLAYFTFNGDLFNLPAGPVSFAIGVDYHGERWRNDPEREEWYSQNTAATTTLPAGHSQFNAQKPKVSVRWQPLDPKYIGAVTLRGTYTEAFHAPTLTELSPAVAQNFPLVHDPLGLTPDPQIEEHIIGNPNLQPGVAYEWSAGIVYSPKWLKGLTLSVDYWNISLRSIATFLGAQFILDHESQFPDLVQRDPISGAITVVTDPSFNLAGADLDGIDYEAIYILDSTIFGGPDWGRLTFTVNGTYLNRFDLTVSPGSPAINLAGQFLSTSFTLTGSLPQLR